MSPEKQFPPLWWHPILAAYLLFVTLMPFVGTSAAHAAEGAPGSVPTAHTRKAYVGLFKDNAVAVVDTVTNRVLSTIQVPKGPHGLVITPDGRKVYVSSDGASTVSVIDTTTDQVVSNIEVGPNPHGLALSPDGRKLLVMAFGANQTMVIDTTSDHILGQIPVPLPHNGVISADGRIAYVGSQQQGATALVILDLLNLTQVGKVELEKTPRGLDLSPDGKSLYFTVAGLDAVLVLDTPTNQIVGQIATGASPHLAVFAPNGQIALSVNQGPGDVGIIATATHTVSATVKVGKAPHWLAVSADGGTAYVTNEGSNDVSLVDLAGRQVIATIPVGNAPRKIAVRGGAVIPASAPAGPPAELPSLPGATTFSDHGTGEVKGLPKIEVVADDYSFAPTSLRGEPGQTLTLEIENTSGTLHNFSLLEAQIDQDIAPKGKIEVQVTFPSSGAMRFFCKLHTAMGMHGQLLASHTAPRDSSPRASSTPKGSPGQ